jgi:hypothetical protein
MPRPRGGPDQLTIAQLEKILEGRRSRLANLQRQRGQLLKRVESVDRKILALGGNGRRGAGGRAKNSRSLSDTIVQVLTGHGGPMKVAQIVKTVLGTGYQTTSDNFRSIVNQALIKDKRFVSADRGHYQLKK